MRSGHCLGKSSWARATRPDLRVLEILRGNVRYAMSKFCLMSSMVWA